MSRKYFTPLRERNFSVTCWPLTLTLSPRGRGKTLRKILLTYLLTNLLTNLRNELNVLTTYRLNVSPIKQLNIHTLHHFNKGLNSCFHTYNIRGSLLQKRINFRHHLNCSIKTRVCTLLIHTNVNKVFIFSI